MDQLSTVTSLPCSTIDDTSQSTTSTSKIKNASTRSGNRGRSTKCRAVAIPNEAIQPQQSASTRESRPTRNVSGSQSDPTLLMSSHQDSHTMKSTLTASRQAAASAAEKVMDAYIEKFSVVGYSNVGVSDGMMQLRVDTSRRPGSLQEAICMYIDYLTYENELRTRISECAVTSPPPPLDFHREEYFRDVMCRPVNFPTARFREWLKLYNVDIEITDPDGQTVSQTTFTPTALNGMSTYDSACVQTAAPNQPFPWHLGPTVNTTQRRRNLRMRSEVGVGVPSWLPAEQHPQLVQIPYIPQYNLHMPRLESGSHQVMSPSSSCYRVDTDAVSTQFQSQETCMTSYMPYNPPQYTTSNDSIYTYGVMLKDEDHADLPSDNATLPSISIMMRNDDDDNPSASALVSGYDILRKLESSTERQINHRNDADNYQMMLPVDIMTSNVSDSNDMMQIIPDRNNANNLSLLQQCVADKEPVEDQSLTLDPVEWNQSASQQQPIDGNNNEMPYDSFQAAESAAAVASLGFVDVNSGTLSFNDTNSGQCWQWSSSHSFTDNFDENTASATAGSDEPVMKLAKLDERS